MDWRKLLLGLSVVLNLLGGVGYTVCMMVPGAAPYCGIGKTVVEAGKVVNTAVLSQLPDSGRP